MTGHLEAQSPSCSLLAIHCQTHCPRQSRRTRLGWRPDGCGRSALVPDWSGSFAPRTGWASGPFRSRWTLDRGGAARNRVSPWRFPEPLPSPPSIKCTGLREPTGGNFRRERRQHTKPSPAEAVDSCFFVWFSLRPEATFRLLLGPMGFVPDAPPSSTFSRFPTGLSLQGRSPHARLHGRLAHSTRPRSGHRHGLRGFGSGCRYELPSAIGPMRRDG